MIMDAKENNINHQTIYPRCLNSSGCIAVLPASSSHGAYIAHCGIPPCPQRARNTPQHASLTDEGEDVSRLNSYLDNSRVSQALHSEKKEKGIPGRTYFSLCIHRVAYPSDDLNREPLSFYEVKTLPLFFEAPLSEKKGGGERDGESSKQETNLSKIIAIDALLWAGLGLLVVLGSYKGEVLLVRTSLAENAENDQKGKELSKHCNPKHNNEECHRFDEVSRFVVLRDIRVKSISSIGVRWRFLDSYISSVVALVYHSSVRLLNIEYPSSPSTCSEFQRGELTNERSFAKKFTSISANVMSYQGEDELQREGVLLCGCTHTCCVSVYVWFHQTKEPELLREVMMGEGVSFFGITTAIRTEKNSANLLDLGPNYRVYFAIAGSSRSGQEEVRSEAKPRVVLEDSSDSFPSNLLRSRETPRGAGTILAEIEDMVTKRLIKQTTREPLNMIYNSLQKKSLDDGVDREGALLEDLAPSLSVSAPTLSSAISESFLLLVSVQRRGSFYGNKLNEPPVKALEITTQQYAFAAAPLKDELGKLGSSIRILPFMQEIVHPCHEKSCFYVGFFSSKGVVWLYLSHPTAKVKDPVSYSASVDLIRKYFIQEGGRDDFIVGVDWRSAAITKAGQNLPPALFLLNLRRISRKTNAGKKEGTPNDVPSEECELSLRPGTMIWSDNGVEILTLCLNQTINKMEGSKGEAMVSINREELRSLICEVVHEESQEILTRLESRLDRLERYIISIKPSLSEGFI